MVLQNGIVRVSAGSKNSFSSHKHSSGYHAEIAVIRLLQSRGWILHFHRAKTKISEIDLILEKNNRVLLIEVKRLDQPWRVFQRISSNQLIKLKANRLLFSLNISEKNYEAFVAWVDIENRVSFCQVD